MIRIDRHNVGNYIERFLDGRTSNEEEQALYDFFGQGDVPRRYRRYRKMFGWYASGMEGPLPTRAASRPMWRWAAAAALAAVLAGGAWMWHEHRERQELYECFEGSYIIRKGQKITDIRQIMPALEQSMADVELLEWEFEMPDEQEKLVEI